MLFTVFLTAGLLLVILADGHQEQEVVVVELFEEEEHQQPQQQQKNVEAEEAARRHGDIIHKIKLLRDLKEALLKELEDKNNKTFTTPLVSFDSTTGGAPSSGAAPAPACATGFPENSGSNFLGAPPADDDEDADPPQHCTPRTTTVSTSSRSGDTIEITILRGLVPDRVALQARVVARGGRGGDHGPLPPPPPTTAAAPSG